MTWSDRSNYILIQGSQWYLFVHFPAEALDVSDGGALLQTPGRLHVPYLCPSALLKIRIILNGGSHLAGVLSQGLWARVSVLGRISAMTVA